MHAFLADIGLAIVVASILGILAYRAGQPLIVAYLLAGIIIGPEIGPQLVKDPEHIDLISEIGLILLLFIIGLEINPNMILRSGKLLLTTGLGQFAISVVMGLVFFSLVTGLAMEDHRVLYLAIFGSLSSTAIVVKSLYDKYELDSLHGRVSLGILIFQDIWAIIILALQPSLNTPGFWPVLRSLLLTVVITVAGFLFSKYVLRWIFARLDRSPEMVVSAAIGWAVTMSGLAGAMNLSVEMGALIAGLAISNYPYSLHVTARVLPLRDVFLTLFFVSLGMKIPLPDPGSMMYLLFLVIFLFVSRPLIVYPLVRLGGGSGRTGFLSSINLTQFSEFSLVIAAVGLSLEHIDKSLMSALLYGMVLTSILSAYSIKYNHKIYGVFHRWNAKRKMRKGLIEGGLASAPDSEEEVAPKKERSIFILGYHRGAQSMVDSLMSHKPELLEKVTVVDFNREILLQLQHYPVQGVFGDLSDRSTLEHIGLQRARVIFITIPDLLLKGTSNLRLVNLCRSLAPQAAILATADDSQRAQKLREAGADGIVMPDHYIGEMLARTLIRLEKKQEILEEMDAANEEEKLQG
ncbi:MAG: sodium:proton exchanger [Spirochaetaceae bacterium]|nr:sodium:proton exchanger [Spirochaetaceae bacterium]|tara:strand:- start:7462 stop:9192 length:1731 start_codon:yes stop_codon:yes gene_type:complete